MSTPFSLLPGATIGIIGGGQLGRMSAMAAARLGFRTHILSDTAQAPAAQTANELTVGAYDDPTVLEEFARNCDVITFEFENISLQGLKQLEAFCPVRPSRHILETSQDRVTEKTRLGKLGFPVAPWRSVPDQAALASLVEFGFPLILKTTCFGYDGKGQFRVNAAEELAALENTDLPYPLVAEKKIDFARELSVMVARNEKGEMRSFTPTENHHRDGILRVCIAPAPISPELARKAQEMAEKLARDLGLIGLLGVEMFEDARGNLLINEIAPRPHNSGHWTMDGCPVDQFEMHIRAVAGLPLPETRRHSDVFMHNLIGPEGMACVPELLEENAACVHLYGKEEARPGRKMGHVNRLYPFGALPGPLTLSSLSPLEAESIQN
ncbi:5-(carboxyamino)imidazole ribonucleotide synthase [Oecophyllibacter saccharovorans]|uniref:5-(carboxyamino)imidazole ribonucleotide synthase n=1 Tax=Oecophyllibacter saccharovorans TaxID=2558360 RepID=UPI0011413D21|nr:5-(carboxyamino)imidazole ribonucleotide synthase [Oecophyllibacter saccharovorans]QDH15844.1 5-(carboxyamino)imidazole ribonucleotide synthase [Oecophyllibacter saccharovorans]